MTRMMIVTAMMLVLGTGVVTTSAQTNGSRRPPAAAAAQASSSAPVNLNTASAVQLEALPGIGKATAERIVEYRQKSGGFKKAEDLMNVRGIGEKNFLKLKPLVTVGSAKGTDAQ
jgi:competence protein ComEA